MAYSSGMETQPIAFWQNIIRELKLAGISQTRVAQACKLSKSSISELVNGVAKREPSYTVGTTLLAMHKRQASKIKQAKEKA